MAYLPEWRYGIIVHKLLLGTDECQAENTVPTDKEAKSFLSLCP